MSPREAAGQLARNRAGTTAVEFAIILSVLLPLCFGIIEVSFLLWTKGALQSTAELVARCSAISSPTCSTTDLAKQYAVTTAANWILNGVITASDVTVSSVTRCPATTGATGTFRMVTITCEYWASGFLVSPYRSQNITVSACYPT